jgi:preprotein translocase subunit YajC
MIDFYQVCWLLLAQVPSAAGGGGGETAGGAERSPGLFEGLGFFLPAMLAMMLIWLFMMPRPQQQASVKTSEMLAKLKKNDRVVTAGGILGVVVNFSSDDEFVTLRVDDSSNTRMQVLATSIVRVLSDKDGKSE